MNKRLRWSFAALVALLAGCMDIPAPREQARPDGETMQPLEPDADPADPTPPLGPWPPTPEMPGDPCATSGPGCLADAGTGAGSDSPGDAGGGSDAGAGAGPRTCEAAGQRFADGEAVPAGDGCNTCRCDDGAIACTERACDPVFCAEFVEEPDGVCSRFPLDPCRFQDPECEDAPGPEATAAP